MNFQDIHNHLTEYGCTIDPYFDEEEGYWACNQINGEVCIIENLPEYLITTICHYCFELGIPAPHHLRKQMEEYRGFRKFTDHDAVERLN